MLLETPAISLDWSVKTCGTLKGTIFSIRWFWVEKSHPKNPQTCNHSEYWFQYLGNVESIPRKPVYPYISNTRNTGSYILKKCLLHTGNVESIRLPAPIARLFQRGCEACFQAGSVPSSTNSLNTPTIWIQMIYGPSKSSNDPIDSI